MRRFTFEAWRPKPGKASDYINDFSDIKRGDLIVLWLRVSERMQAFNGHLEHAENALTKAVLNRGATVVGVVRWVGTGADPVWIARAAKMAATHNAKILAESTDRFIRSACYQTNRPDVQASTAELEDLKYFAKGATLVTYLHPDATPTKVRSYQRKRGQQANGRRGGRPTDRSAGYKARRAKALRPKALHLAGEGKSLSQIAKATGVPRSTIHRWLQQSLGVSHFSIPKNRVRRNKRLQIKQFVRKPGRNTAAVNH